MTLLLTSQGIQEGFKDIFLSLVPKPPKDISVSYITTASFGEEGDKSWVNNAKKQLQSLGISNIEDLDIRGKNSKDLYETLSQKDIILVNGGNTFYILKYSRESGFDKVVKRLINEGKIYIGVSAGSYIACPTIEQSHWKHQDRSSLEEGVKTTKYPVVALHDTQAVLVMGDVIKVIVEGKKEFFNQFREV